MNYFTKEFHLMEWLSYANHKLKLSKKAEQKDEDFYRKVYNKRYAVYLNNEKNCDWYKDPKEELQKIIDYINRADITEEKRKEVLIYKQGFEYVNRERLKNPKVYKFDEKICEEKFAEQNRFLINIYSHLPEEILNKIADIRVFALGYASNEVKRLLYPYCAELRRKLKQIRNKAYDETNDAEDYLTKVIGFNDYDDCIITGIEENDGDIYIKCDYKDFIIKDGEIIEGKEMPVNKFDKDVPNSPWSRIIASELHRKDEKFELHFLVSNLNEIGKEDLCYLTVRGTDIIKISE